MAQPKGAVNAAHSFPRLVQGAPIPYWLQAPNAQELLSPLLADGQPQRLVCVQHCPASQVVPGPQQAPPQAWAAGQQSPPTQAEPAAQQVDPHT
jgi:hypothetical protein